MPQRFDTALRLAFIAFRNVGQYLDNFRVAIHGSKKGLLWSMAIAQFMSNSQSNRGEANSTFIAYLASDASFICKTTATKKLILHYHFEDETAVRFGVGRTMNKDDGYWDASSEVSICRGSGRVGGVLATRSLGEMFVGVKNQFVHGCILCLPIRNRFSVTALCDTSGFSCCICRYTA